MPLLLLTSWDITETWWQSVISIFNSWEVFCMAVLLLGLVLTSCPHCSGRLTRQQEDPECRCLYTWMDQGLRSAIRLQRSYEVQMVSSSSRQMFSTAAWIFTFSHHSPLLGVLAASSVHTPSSPAFLPGQRLSLQTGGLFLPGSFFFNII